MYAWVKNGENNPQAPPPTAKRRLHRRPWPRPLNGVHSNPIPAIALGRRRRRPSKACAPTPSTLPTKSPAAQTGSDNSGATTLASICRRNNQSNSIKSHRIRPSSHGRVRFAFSFSFHERWPKIKGKKEVSAPD